MAQSWVAYAIDGGTISLGNEMQHAVVGAASAGYRLGVVLADIACEDINMIERMWTGQDKREDRACRGDAAVNQAFEHLTLAEKAANGWSRLLEREIKARRQRIRTWSPERYLALYVPSALESPVERTDMFDVFLTYDSDDRAEVEQVYEYLIRRGIRAWMDSHCLRPGDLWQEVIEAELLRTPAVAVCVGKKGLGRWAAGEMRVALQQAVDRTIRVIPIRLPGIIPAFRLPPFLARFMWVDMTRGIDAAAVSKLITGIK